MQLSTTNGRFILALDDATGGIASLKIAGDEFVSRHQVEPLLRLRFRDAAGDNIDLSSNDLTLENVVVTPNDLTLVFSGLINDKYPASITASVQVENENGAEGFRWSLSLKHSQPGFLEWVEYPCVTVRPDFLAQGGPATLFWPAVEGVMIENLQTRRNGGGLAYQPTDYPNHGWGGYYPGCAQMQFMAYLRGQSGLYLATHDPEHITKEIEFVPKEGNEGVRLIFKTYLGAIAPDTSYTLPFPVIMRSFTGDWHDAAEIYRSWIKTTDTLPPPLIQRTDRQPWLDDSPIVVTYPVTGQGHHAGPTQPNEHFPPTAALPAIDRLSSQLSHDPDKPAPLLALLMHWEGTAPWSPPYVWPPRGGAEDMRNFAGALHERGHHLGLYCSGVAWTNTSVTGDGTYNRTADLEADNKKLLGSMCRGPHGEYECKICNGPEIRLGYDICVSTEFARDVMASEAVKIASASVDYIQLFDQNLGCAAYQCYDAAHGHAPAPGPWQTRAMNQLIQTVRQRLSESGHPNVILGCESAAAESYIGQLPLNDLRFHMGFAYGRPVPAYAYVFHEYTTNFMGNQVEALELIDHQRSPENHYLRLAHAFCAGDLLSVVLKNGGELHWAWCVKWDVPPPPQEPYRDFVAHLNAWRRGAAKPFLYFGRMEKPHPYECAGRIRLQLREKFQGALDYPAVLTSRWRSPDGKDAQLLVNYTSKEQSVKFQLDKADPAFSSLRQICLWRDPESGTPEAIPVNDAISKIILPPLSAILVEFVENK